LAKADTAFQASVGQPNEPYLARLILDAAERRMLPVLDLDLSVAIGQCDYGVAALACRVGERFRSRNIAIMFYDTKNFKLA
jgi:hypothetical protein